MHFYLHGWPFDFMSMCHFMLQTLVYRWNLWTLVTRLCKSTTKYDKKTFIQLFFWLQLPLYLNAYWLSVSQQSGTRCLFKICQPIVPCFYDNNSLLVSSMCSKDNDVRIIPPIKQWLHIGMFSVWQNTSEVSKSYFETELSQKLKTFNNTQQSCA